MLVTFVKYLNNMMVYAVAVIATNNIVNGPFKYMFTNFSKHVIFNLNNNGIIVCEIEKYHENRKG